VILVASQASLGDGFRDALAFVGAATRNDFEGMDAIQSAASPAGLAGSLAGIVIWLAERDGGDAGDWAAGELAPAVADLR
jgi:hypothetical protein